MTIDAKVIADSVSLNGDRLTTVQATGPRFILAEVNTHRDFSRNSASSRAIPVSRQLERIRMNPARPVEWPAEQPGMQGGRLLEGLAEADAIEFWESARDAAVKEVEWYLRKRPEKERRVHKSVINRVLEPFMWHTMVISSTRWDNFYEQRCSPLAQPEFRVMAEAIRDAIEESDPVYKDCPGKGVPLWDSYHMPYVDEEEAHTFESIGMDPRSVSIARCARTSYLTQEGKRDPDEDIKLFDRLCNPGEGPPHMSPFEHVASPVRALNVATTPGNFDGWLQQRHVRFPPKRRRLEDRQDMIALALRLKSEREARRRSDG